MTVKNIRTERNLTRSISIYEYVQLIQIRFARAVFDKDQVIGWYGEMFPSLIRLGKVFSIPPNVRKTYHFCKPTFAKEEIGRGDRFTLLGRAGICPEPIVSIPLTSKKTHNSCKRPLVSPEPVRNLFATDGFS